MKRTTLCATVSSITLLIAACAGLRAAEQQVKPLVVPTHPRILFRKDDLAELRRRCLTTHAREYAILKAAADRSIFLEAKPIAPGLLYQLTGESRYLLEHQCAAMTNAPARTLPIHVFLPF